MITLSSGLITIQALISPAWRTESSPQGRTLKVAASAGAPMPTPSAKPPAAVTAVVMNERRERLIVMAVPSRSRAHQGCGAVHRAAKPLVGAATADIGEIQVDVGVSRIG